MASLIVVITIIVILSQEIAVFAINDGQDHRQKKEKSKLPAIVYGPINHQIGNQYQPAEPGQTSGTTAVPETSGVYGSTTSQNHNRYVTIGQAKQVYLTVPANDGPFSISHPGFIMSQNIGADDLMFDLDNPTQKPTQKLTSAFNTFQQEFDRITRLARPFLTNNERTLQLWRKAREDFQRQTKEIDWLSTVASHRMKLLKLYEQLSIMHNYLKKYSTLSPEALTSAKEKERNLAESEKKLKLKTQNLLEYVLLN